MPWSDGMIVGSAAYAIAASTNPRIRVVAGPGTGKSFAVKRRVARLLESGVQPDGILPVTFTRVAAEDLHRELVGMNVPGCDSLNGVTLHSLALRMLMRNHVLEATGRNARPLNDFEVDALVCDLVDAHGGKREVSKLLMAYEAAWARLQHHEPGHVQSAEDTAFSANLIAWMRFHEAMLIGEVIPQFYEYLRSNPVAPERTEHQHILVDEYQDLNKAEQGVIQLLSTDAHVCIVGDDDQSIYSFKHAHPEGIRQWISLNQDAHDLELSECRRCPTTVVSIANSLIGHNQMRIVPRQLTPRPQNGPGVVQIIQYDRLADEVAGIATIVREFIEAGVPPGDILILAQRGVIGTPIYESLRGYNVPTRSYYAEAELDALDAQRRFALLKLFVDREDRVALRWLVGHASRVSTRLAIAELERIASSTGSHHGRRWSNSPMASLRSDILDPSCRRSTELCKSSTPSKRFRTSPPLSTICCRSATIPSATCVTSLLACSPKSAKEIVQPGCSSFCRRSQGPRSRQKSLTCEL
jgi:DNA helicase-2/ATP-dependent DNA helicase PcrA